MSSLTEVRVPQEHVNDDTVVIVDWAVESAERVEAGQTLVTIETSKSTFDVDAPCAGFVQRRAEAGDSVAIGAVLCVIGDDVESVEPAAVAVAETNGAATHSATRFSRDARALLDEHALDEANFAGRGLVRAADVRAHLEGKPAPVRKRPPSTHRVAVKSSDAFAPVVTRVPTRVEPLSRQKGLEIQFLRSGHARTLPSQVTVAVPTRDKTAALARDPSLRERLSAAIVFEVARLLRKYPNLNGYYEDGAAHLYEAVNVGFAIDGEHGLKVPVIRDADRKSMQEIIDETRDLVVRYLDDSILPESFADGTFTISNLAGEGVETFTPLINHGQSAILGIGGDVIRPESGHGQTNLVLVFDHQLSAGLEAARFLGELRERMQGHEASLLSSTEPAATVEEPCCSLCLRPYGELRDENRHLLQSVTDDGTPQLVCEVCFQGW